MGGPGSGTGRPQGNVSAASILDTILTSITGLNAALYKASAHELKAIGIGLADKPFERAALMWSDFKGTRADDILEAGYFDGEQEGIQFRISRWSSIR